MQCAETKFILVPAWQMSARELTLAVKRHAEVPAKRSPSRATSSNGLNSPEVSILPGAPADLEISFLESDVPCQVFLERVSMQ
jgi:hypothetical protein